MVQSRMTRKMSADWITGQQFQNQIIHLFEISDLFETALPHNHACTIYK